MFAAGRDNAAVAKELRVSVRSVQRWRRSWRGRGAEGLQSRGPASHPKLNDALFAVLEEELARGPVAHGWPDRSWTLARIKTLIGRRFHKTMTRSSSRYRPRSARPRRTRRPDSPRGRWDSRRQRPREHATHGAACHGPAARPQRRPSSVTGKGPVIAGIWGDRNAAGRPRSCRQVLRIAVPGPLPGSRQGCARVSIPAPARTGADTSCSSGPTDGASPGKPEPQYAA
jgi:transposase